MSLVYCTYQSGSFKRLNIYLDKEDSTCIQSSRIFLIPSRESFSRLIDAPWPGSSCAESSNNP